MHPRLSGARLSLQAGILLVSLKRALYKLPAAKRHPIGKIPAPGSEAVRAATLSVSFQLISS